MGLECFSSKSEASLSFSNRIRYWNNTYSQKIQLSYNFSAVVWGLALVDNRFLSSILFHKDYRYSFTINFLNFIYRVYWSWLSLNSEDLLTQKTWEEASSLFLFLHGHLYNLATLTLSLAFSDIIYIEAIYSEHSSLPLSSSVDFSYNKLLILRSRDTSKQEVIFLSMIRGVFLTRTCGSNNLTLILFKLSWT